MTEHHEGCGCSECYEKFKELEAKFCKKFEELNNPTDEEVVELFLKATSEKDS